MRGSREQERVGPQRASRAGDELDSVEVRESPVHGRGVFARRRLRPGQWIGRFEGTPTDEDGTYVLWVCDDRGGEVGIRGRNALRFLNHGKPPNAEFEDVDLYAIRNVQPGAELVIDYGAAWSDAFDGAKGHELDGHDEDGHAATRDET